MSEEGYRRLEEAITKYPGGMRKGSLIVLMKVAQDMGRYSIDDEIFKRVIVPDLDATLVHFRQFPIDAQTIEIAIKRNMAYLAMRERPTGFEDNQQGNKALTDSQRAILEYEAVKIIKGRSPEKVLKPVVHMDSGSDVNSLVRLGWTIPPQYAPIPHRLSQLLISKSLLFDRKEIDDEIKKEKLDEDQLNYVRMNFEVLKNLTGYTPQEALDSLF